MMLTPRYTATATLTGLSNGSLTFGPPDAGLVLSLAPFYQGPKGDKGDKGDTGPAPALTWGGYIFWPSTAAGAATVSGQPGAVRSHTSGGATVFRFIPTVSNPLLDAFYTTYSGGVLSGLIVSRG